MENRERYKRLIMFLASAVIIAIETLLFAYILERILYDACNFTSNVLNYVCHSFLNVLLLVFILLLQNLRWF